MEKFYTQSLELLSFRVSIINNNNNNLVVLTCYFPYQIEYRRDKMVLIRLGADNVWYSKYEYRRKNKGTNQVWYLKLRYVELRPKKLPKMYACTLNARYN